MEKQQRNRHSRNILVTGLPGIGKSTLIERLVSGIQRPMTGFFTREIREKWKRVGFSITTLDGRKGILAHREIMGHFRVGKYGVNVEDIDRVAVPSMIPARLDVIVVIDEIGKMESFSALFRESLIRVLDSENPVIGSIALRGGGSFIEEVKVRKDVSLIEVTEKNREELVNLIMKMFEYSGCPIAQNSSPENSSVTVA
jgi:nucleoside-triphosphatase